MNRLLLLYDTDDRDFARDISDLVKAMDVDVEMIPRAPDGGTTLQQKEANFFTNVDAALFLLTPGSERHGKSYPSPSVADEMGQARERFKEEPWRVIYLVDKECSIQAVDQRAYIDFDRKDHRSMIEAVRRLILALKDAGLLAAHLPAPPPKPPEIDVGAVLAVLNDEKKNLLIRLSQSPNGIMFYHDFVKMAGVMHVSQTDGNLAVRDLLGIPLVSYAQGVAGVGGTATIFLTNAGWDVVRVLRAKERADEEAARKPVAPVIRVPGNPPGRPAPG